MVSPVRSFTAYCQTEAWGGESEIYPTTTTDQSAELGGRKTGEDGGREREKKSVK